MKAEEYQERLVQVDDWAVRLTTYRLGEKFHCKADNVSPGAWLARTIAPTKAEAEEQALARVRQLLSRTRRVAV